MAILVLNCILNIFITGERGVGKALAMLGGGGGTKRFGVVLTWVLVVLAMLKGGGGRKIFQTHQNPPRKGMVTNYGEGGYKTGVGGGGT